MELDECGECGGDSSTCCNNFGDVNEDGNWNIIDILLLVNCILQSNCINIDNSCVVDVNQDGSWNITDIIVLVNCVLAGNCMEL